MILWKSFLKKRHKTRVLDAKYKSTLASIHPSINFQPALVSYYCAPLLKSKAERHSETDLNPKSNMVILSRLTSNSSSCCMLEVRFGTNLVSVLQWFAAVLLVFQGFGRQRSHRGIEEWFSDSRNASFGGSVSQHQARKHTGCWSGQVSSYGTSPFAFCLYVVRVLLLPGQISEDQCLCSQFRSCVADLDWIGGSESLELWFFCEFGMQCWSIV